MLWTLLLFSCCCAEANRTIKTLHLCHFCKVVWSKDRSGIFYLKYFYWCCVYNFAKSVDEMNKYYSGFRKLVTLWSILFSIRHIASYMSKWIHIFTCVRLDIFLAIFRNESIFEYVYNEFISRQLLITIYSTNKHLFQSHWLGRDEHLSIYSKLEITLWSNAESRVFLTRFARYNFHFLSRL